VPEENISSGSFEELAMPLFDSLYNFARWLTHDREEAEDLVQETYSKALKGFPSFQQGTNFRAWIYRILQGESLEPSTTETPESLLIDRSNQQMVQEAIEELPINFREIILLCDVEEMSYREIAETISIPIGTVMSRLARARNALRLGLVKRLQGV
jgi:RNA polymerase sigma-70 factor (ECF subfamily)